MPKSSFTQNQMRAILFDLGAGRMVKDISRKHGISIRTLYRWRTKLASKQQPAKGRLRSLEVEYRQLKRRFAELTLDYVTLRSALMKDAKGDC